MRMTLNGLAEHLGLSINRSTVTDVIPYETKDRILTAARRFTRRNFFARSLHAQYRARS